MPTSEEGTVPTFLQAIDELRAALKQYADALEIRTMEEKKEAMKRKAALDDFLGFMEIKQQERPYQDYLYRAHVHGDPYPRIRDNTTGKFCDSFGADYDLGMEFHGAGSLDTAVNDFTAPDDILYQLSRQLGKTQYQYTAKKNGLEPEETRLVSLSAKFPWTVQRTCSKGRGTAAGKLPGLAIFETAKIQAAGSYLFRVGDLLAYLDQSEWSSSITISQQLRDWADNCKEHVCWSVIPRAALVAFVPLDKLCQQNDAVSQRFLRPVFTQSIYLGSFRRKEKECLSHEAYAHRVERFLRNILSCVPPHYDIEQLDVSKVQWWFEDEEAMEFGYYVLFLDSGRLQNTIETVLKLAAEEARQRRPKQADDGDDAIETSLAALSI